MEKRTFLYREDYNKTTNPNKIEARTKLRKLIKPHQTIWKTMKDYINSLKVDEEFKRKELLGNIYKTNMASFETSVDQYRVMLVHIKVLDHIGYGLYKKLRNIPESLTTKQLKQYAYNSGWKSWFIPLDMMDKLDENTM